MKVTDFFVGAQVTPESRDAGYRFALWSIIIAAAILKFVFVCNTIGSDDIRYFHFAELLSRLQPFTTLDHAGSRIIFLLLVGLPGAWLGQIVYSSVASIVYSSLAEILVAFFVLRQFGPRPALIAVLFVSFSGISLAYSGTFLPDALLAFVFSLIAIKLYLILSQEKPFSWKDMLVVGLYIGVAYSVKDTGILLLPPVAFALLFLPSPSTLRQRFTSLATIAAGFLIVTIAEMFVLYLFSGDFFYRSHAIAAVHNVAIGQASSLYDFLRRGYWNLWSVIYRWDFLLVPTMLGIWVSVYVIRRWRAAAVLGFMTLFCAAYMLFGSSSFTRLVNLPFQERYVHPLLPLIGISLAIYFFHTRRPIRVAISSLIAVHIIIGLYGTLETVGDRYYEGFLRDAAIGVQIIHEEGEPIFVDERVKDGLRQMLPYDEWKDLKVATDTAEIAPGYYIMHPNPYWAGKRYDKLKELPLAFTVDTDQRLIARLFPQCRRPARLPAVFRHAGP